MLAGLTCLPIYGVAVLLSTLTHQPDYMTDFPAYADYVTTTSFRIGHIFGSIAGTGVGLLGIIALYGLLVRTRSGSLALVGLVLCVLGNSLILPLFGLAAFGQPAVGDAFKDGIEGAERINDDMYGATTLATGVIGTLLYSVGAVLLGVGIWRSGVLPKAAGALFGLGVPLIAFFGLAIGLAQTLGSVLLIVAGVMLVLSARQVLDESDGRHVGLGQAG
jgi:hypothetical protein